MRVVIAGGTGALGRRLADARAARGDEVVVLTRRPGGGPHRQVGWDGRTVGEWASELSGAAVVNLAGELVDRRPTAANVRLLTASRVDPTRALVAAAARVDVPPPVWVQASTLAIHGDAGDTELDEHSPPADGPPQMAGVATAWEDAVAGARCERRVVLRTGIVLDRDTPALDRLLSVTRLGLGGRIGDGRQWISWAHIADWLRVVDLALDSDLSGVVVTGSPNPVRNAELMSTLRHVLHRPPAPPTPAWAVRLGSVALRTDPALALTGRRAVPRVLLDRGFDFRFPSLSAALQDLVGG